MIIDRLPLERDLMSRFANVQGSVREALRTLEVQGLLRIKPGWIGGAVEAEIPPKKIAEMLRNDLHFESLNGLQIYQPRKTLEPQLAVSVAATLTDDDFSTQQTRLEKSGGGWTDIERVQELRVAEIEFLDPTPMALAGRHRIRIMMIPEQNQKFRNCSAKMRLNPSG